MLFQVDQSTSDLLLVTEVLICIALVGLFIVLNTYLQKWKITLLHESGICLIIGILSGYLLHTIFGETSKFNKGFFFHFMLPLIVFGAGYEMKRKRFFENFGIIAMLGILGTVISFFVVGVFTYYWSTLGLLHDIGGHTVYITIQEGLMVGAALSATDVVCTLAMVREERTPRLHTILFGESTSNDAVAIILLTMIQGVDVSKFSAVDFFELIGDFLFICLTSVLLGVVVGALCSYSTKVLRSLRKWPNRETAVMIYIAWIGYIIAEIVDISGVICILTSSIVAGHYSYYNLSSEARILTNFYHFIGEGAEALVFAYLGLTAYSSNFFSIPPLFLLLVFVSAFIARFIGTFVLSTFFRVLTCGRHRLSNKDLSMICVGGIVRGGISYALALAFIGNNSEILQVIVLGFVIVGTVFFGIALPLWVKFMNVSEVRDVNVGVEKGWLQVKWEYFDGKYFKKWLVNIEGLREEKMRAEQLVVNQEL